MNVTCSAEPCPVILNATCVFYEGNTLVYTGIVTNDNLQTALQKIDQKFQDSNLGYIFTNGIEQLAPGQPVMLGGALVKNTTIGGLYNLAFAGTLEASALITTGGSSTDFVKGDGSLDPTSYQPAGNYITNLTGDVLASGPGSVAATLATVFGSPGTYGNSGSVPSITVDSKGRVTNVTPTPINYPVQSLSFVGDVDGFGYTGSPVTLTLDTVNTDVYGSNNFLKFAVNGKGLITSATPVSGGDITTALGYVPVDNIIELSINGVAHNLTANRSWNVGTVTGVSIIAGTGLNASISNPNTTPSISIINTAPDQTVVLTGGFGISVTGSYPNFTITNDYPDITGGTVTTFSAGNLSPLFTTSVTNPTTTPALSFALSSAAANTVLAGPNGGAGTPTYRALVAADLPSLSYISNISTTAPLATTGGLTPTLSISQAGASTDGYLSSADWTTFNSKQPAGNYITDLTGDGTASGPGSAGFTLATVNATTGTFGSSTQVPVITVNGKGLVTCVTTDTISGSLEFVGDVTGVGSTGACTTLTLATVNNDVYTSETLLNIAVNGKGLITSANPTTAGDICSTLGYTPEDVANKSTCTSLGVSNTLYPTQLAVKTYVDSATAGGIILQGNWNANTNVPDITGTTTTGWAWRVDVAGTTNLGGITDWQVGDLAVKSATGWVKLDNSDSVTSVFGRSGAVVATTGDYLTCQVTECNNLYYTDARVRAAIGHTAPLTYNSTTGVFGITQSNATTDGYLSATDWTTFNDKQPALGYTPVNQTRQLTINGTTYDLTADRSWSVGTVTSVTGSAPLASSGGTTPNLTISQSGTASDGYLSSTDWNHFNSHTSCTGTVTCVAACTSTTGVSITGSPITSSGTLGFNIATASSVCTGLLSSADWNTFNSHTSCSGTVTSVGLTSSTTGVSIACSPVTSSGNISLNIATASSLCTGLLTSADWNSFNSRTSCTGTVTCVNATGTNISVTGSPITTSGTLAISLSGANVCSALGYTPYNATNPNGYTTCVGTVTSVGIVATNINVCSSPVTTSGNICLNLTGANVSSALGYTPVQPNGTGATGTWPISITGSAGSASSASFASTVCVNSGNTSGAWYPITWHSGNTLYSSSGVEIYAAGNYIRSQYINTTDSLEGTATCWVIKNGDNYHRSITNSTAAAVIQGSASGTWSINISGSASSATNASCASNADTVDGYHASAFPYRSSGSSGYYQVADWMQFNTTAGLYWPSYNSAHIYPNTSTSYGSIRIDGSRSGWRGITFDGSVTLMMNDNETGFYKDGYGWQWRWENGTAYVNKNSYGGGTSATVLDSSNVNSYAVPSRGQSGWNDNTVINNVVGLMAWKNYGNSHVIFDASQSTSPSGGGVNNTNPTYNWSATYPTLMGWNGSQTYGVRVDCARSADVAGSACVANTACNVLFTTGGATCSTVRNGNNNLITSNGCWSFVAGRYNTMDSQDSVIAGGTDNCMAAYGCSFVGGGQYNCVQANYSSVVGGYFNSSYGYTSTVVGGQFNCNYGNGGFIGGGQYNGISSGCVYMGAIVGGGSNSIYGGAYNFIGGGNSNTIFSSANASSIIGGQSNSIGSCGGTCNIHIIGGGISGSVNNYTYVNNLCQIGGGLSDCRVKNNICNTGFGLNEILQLRPVSYCFNGDTSKKFGFIAQEIQEVIPELVSFNPVEKLGPNNERTIFGDGEPLLEFDKDAIFASYVNAFKDLYRLNQGLEAEISNIKEILKRNNLL